MTRGAALTALLMLALALAGCSDSGSDPEPSPAERLSPPGFTMCLIASNGVCVPRAAITMRTALAGETGGITARLTNSGDAPWDLRALTAPEDLEVTVSAGEDPGDPAQLPLPVAPGEQIHVHFVIPAGLSPRTIIGEVNFDLQTVEGARIALTIPIAGTVRRCIHPVKNCDGDWFTGCEVDTDTDDQHCGGCNTPCEGLHGDATCVSGSCVLQACDPGYFGPDCEPCPGADAGEACAGNGTCDDGAEGSGACTCKEGWVGEGCDVDVDECDTGDADCHALATCTNTDGGFTCDCPDGYDGDGTSCLGTTGAGCDDNDQCLDTCVDGACAPASDTGGACDDADDCPARHLCEGGACLLPAGEPCGDNADCATGACITDLCAVPSDTGGPCDEDADCVEGRTCVSADDDDIPDSCAAPNGLPCGDNLDCVGGSCAPGPEGDLLCGARAGDACDEDADCAVGLCSDTDGDETPDTCGATDGDACERASDCASGDCGLVGDAGLCGACADDAACNARLDDDGLCPGECVPQVNALTCRGEVAFGLCYTRGDAPPNTHEVVEAEGIRITPTQVPEGVYQVGDQVDLVLTVENVSDAAITARFSNRLPLTWELRDDNFRDLRELTLGAGESMELTGTLVAQTPNLLSGAVNALDVTVERAGFTVLGPIAFPDDGNTVTCGDATFPATYQSGTNGYYRNACCDGVFFPGAHCCTTDDCDQGVCADGYCVTRVPQFTSANTWPYGHQRVLLVLADMEDIVPAPDICTDREDDLREDLFLDQVEGWLHSMIQQRTNIPERQLFMDWTVLAGLDSADYIADGQYTKGPYFDSLQGWLQDQGCIGDYHDYDKVIVVSGMIDIPFGGQAFGDGHIAMRYARNDLLMTHELMHTLGARDLYLDLGDRFQYRGDLMGNTLNFTPAPNDGVAWAEVGLGDVNLDGVIDVYENAYYPDALVLAGIQATVHQGRRTVEVTGTVLAEQDGELLPLPCRRYNATRCPYTVTLSDFGPSQFGFPNPLVFGLGQEDIDAIVDSGQINLRVEAGYLHTDADFQRVNLSLDENVTVDVDVQP